MYRKVNISALAALIISAYLLSSCSTTRVLATGEYRLASDKVTVTDNDKSLNTNKLESYIKQRPNNYLLFGWNPFLNVYNWSNPKRDTAFGRFFKKIGVAPVVYNPELVNSSVENLERHLEYLGYYGSNVEANVNVKRKLVSVEYLVTPGKQFRIKDINYNIETGEDFASDFMSDTSNVTIKRGDVLSESSLEKESTRSAARLRNLGYYGFSKNYYFYEADTLSIPGEAVLNATVREYTRNESEKDAKPLVKYVFGDVKISYPQQMKIKEKVLTNLNTIRPGDTYSERVVNSTYSRLSSLGMLSSVNVELTQADSNRINADIRLAQSRLQGFKINLEGSSNSSGLLGISPGLSFYHKNIFHGGETFNMSFMGNFQFKPNSSVRSNELGVSAGIRFPRFLFLPLRWFQTTVPSTEIKASYNYQDRPEYKRNILSTSIGYSGSHKNFYYQFSPLQLSIVRLFNVDSGFYESLSDNPFLKNAYQDHFDLGLGTTLYYTTNSDVNPKTTYHYFRFQGNVSGNVLSLFKPLMDKDSNGAGMIWNTPFSQYIRGEFSVGKTWVFGNKSNHSLASRFLIGAGHSYGNSSALPFEQHFYSGGANGLRGWQARSIGPGTSQKDTTFVIPSQTGDMKIEANLEYRFGMFWKLDGALFVDAGNVWTLSNDDTDAAGKFNMDNFLPAIAADWGIGVRLDLDFILVRVDWGLVTRDPSRDSGHRWVGPSGWFKNDGFAIHFGVGYPF